MILPGARALGGAALAGPLSAWAQEPPAAIGAGSLVQVFAGLALVLALVIGAAVIMRRIGRVPGLSNEAIRTVAAAAVGTRERVVLLEVGESWILVGVAPGQVRALATLPRSELAAPAGAARGAPPFAQLLQRFTDRRDGSA
ncbi:MAG: flagellar biosynthetic protein FliO [Betaproteobacteria bacterium]|nr:MAG: flagellar biosynthetic protein FliO [Betaproteobacteria bacterium]